jgi:hypothetical protein
MMLNVGLKVLVILIITGPRISKYSLVKMSKLAKNFLKTQEAIRENVENDENLSRTVEQDLDIDKIINEIGTGRSPCIYIFRECTQSEQKLQKCQLRWIATIPEYID